MEHKRNGFAHLAVLGALGLGLPGFVFAGPPSVRPQVPQRTEHLDLRPPTTLTAGLDKVSTAFPSALHRQTLGSTQEFQLPALGTQGRTPSRVEEFARRVHREGLPVARLWENKSALVSLGLNQRGKPGLWLTQKVP